MSITPTRLSAPGAFGSVEEGHAKGAPFRVMIVHPGPSPAFAAVAPAAVVVIDVGVSG